MWMLPNSRCNHNQHSYSTGANSWLGPGELEVLIYRSRSYVRSIFDDYTYKKSRLQPGSNRGLESKEWSNKEIKITTNLDHDHNSNRSPWYDHRRHQTRKGCHWHSEAGQYTAVFFLPNSHHNFHDCNWHGNAVKTTGWSVVRLGTYVEELLTRYSISECINQIGNDLIKHLRFWLVWRDQIGSVHTLFLEDWLYCANSCIFPGPVKCVNTYCLQV